MAEPDWYRSVTWTPAIAAEFEVRLSRSRVYNRPQYLRIQGISLTDSADAAVREAGRGLLRRVSAEYPESIDAKFGWELLGVSLMREGRLDEAADALRETIRLCQVSPIGASGTSGTTGLRLAEVLLERGNPADLPEVSVLLADVGPKVVEQAFLRDVLYRYLLAGSRAASRLGDRESASDMAQRALRVADETSPSLPRHPTVGRPVATEAERAELASIAAAGR